MTNPAGLLMHCKMNSAQQKHVFANTVWCGLSILKKQTKVYQGKLQLCKCVCVYVQYWRGPVVQLCIAISGLPQLEEVLLCVSGQHVLI